MTHMTSNQDYIQQLQIEQPDDTNTINKINMKTNGPTAILIILSSEPRV